MQLSQDQLKTMLQSPQFQGQDPSQVVKSIVSQGNTIEGLNLSQQDVPVSQPPIQGQSSPMQSPMGATGQTNPEPSLAKNIGSLISPIKWGEGLAKFGGETFTGLANLATQGASAIGIPQAPTGVNKQIRDWSTAKGATWGEQLGKLAGDIGSLATPEGATEGLIGGIASKGGRLAARAGVGAAAFGGQAAAKSGDISKAPGAALAGAALPVVGAGLGAAARNAFGDLAENVGKAIGITGKQSIQSAQEIIPKATSALQTIYDTAKDIVVKDVDGVEKTFEPTKATFGESLQALSQAKNIIYKQYTDLASKAGDAGAIFSGKDFNSLISKMQGELENSGPDAISTANKLIKNLEDNYGKTLADGTTEFKNVPLGDMQKYLESINTHVNPISDKAGSEIYGTLSKSIRDIMDNKITNSTGEGYQILRNQYSDLKSVEQGLVNQFKKSLRGTGSGIANWVEGFGTLDTLVGMATKSPAEMAMGVGKIGLGSVMKVLRSPETNLQRAFKMIGEQSGGSEQSGIGKFLTGEK